MSFPVFGYAFLAGIVPSLLWLYFWTREDTLHPESKTILIVSFGAGMIAVVLAVFGEQYTGPLVTDQTLRYIIWAGIEEIAKFVAVGAVALHSLQNDEPIDAMIYCITAALGFAALENTLFLFGPLHDGEVLQTILTGNMRFVGATLVHVVSSAMIGFALGFTYYHSAMVRIGATVVGVGAAIALHAAFNLSIVNATVYDALRTFAWVWGAVIILIVLFEEVKAVEPRYVR